MFEVGASHAGHFKMYIFVEAMVEDDKRQIDHR